VARYWRSVLFIRNFGISGYRSFGEQMSWLEDLGKVNLLIGTNNSGKSNVLRFIRERFCDIEDLVTSGVDLSALSPDDFCRFSSRPIVGFGLKCQFSRSLMSQYLRESARDERARTILRAVEEKLPEGMEIRFLYEVQHNRNRCFGSVVDVSPSFDSLVRKFEIENPRIGRHYDANERELCKNIWLGLVQYAKSTRGNKHISLVPAHRKLTGDVENASTILSGSGLIRQIGKWINFIGKEHASRLKGERLEQFVRTVTGYSDARLRVVSQDTQIEIMLDNQSFSLDDMATGLHELVLLAAYCSEIEESVICLEEPETHLHPTWQRALVDYIQNETSNQYFIATHSAHIIDIPGVPVFQVRREGKLSTVRKVGCDDDTLLTLRDLGYRASDLLQANYILWVEGPSDRLYLLHWLKLVTPALKEGVHFSVVYYGGSMLVHLSGHQLDESPDAFGSDILNPILLARLNQNFGVLMDSDWTSEEPPTDKKWKAKQKCKEDLVSRQRFAWITHGRTIENYCVVEDLGSAVKILNANYKYDSPSDVYQTAYKFENTQGSKVEDKVSLANAYIRVQNELADDHVKESKSSGESQKRRDFLIERLKQEPTGKLHDHLVELANAIHAAQGEPIPPSA